MEEERLTQEDINEINELFGISTVNISERSAVEDVILNPGEVVERYEGLLNMDELAAVITASLRPSDINPEFPTLESLEDVKVDEHIIKSSVEELKESVKQIAQENYPNLWDYYTYGCPEYTQIYAGNISRRTRQNSDKTDYLIIKFPEITITNSNKKSHKINDLYVLFCVNYNDKELYLGNTIYGLRGMVTDDEDYSQYRHSHLHGDSTTRFDNFCLGSSEFGHSLLELSSDFDIDKFDYLLNQLDSYVRWESLEGGPYRIIENIRPRGFDNLNSLTDRDIQECIDLFFENYHIPLTIDYTYNAQYIFGLDEDKVKELVNSLNLKKVYKADNAYYNHFTESGDGSVTTKIKQPHALKFRGEQVDIIITCKNIRKVDPNWEVVNHPQYVSRIVQLFNNKIYDYNNKIRFN